MPAWSPSEGRREKTELIGQLLFSGGLIIAVMGVDNLIHVVVPYLCKWNHTYYDATGENGGGDRCRVDPSLMPLTASWLGQTSRKTHTGGTGKVRIDQITDGTGELLLIVVGLCHCGYEENCPYILEMHIEEIRDKLSVCLNLLQNVAAEKQLKKTQQCGS